MTSTASVDLLVLISNCPLVTSEDQQTLHLDNVTISHAGRYTCTADNGVGDPVTEHVLITVLCKYIIQYLSTLVCEYNCTSILNTSLTLSISLSLFP